MRIHRLFFYRDIPLRRPSFARETQDDGGSLEEKQLRGHRGEGAGGICEKRRSNDESGTSRRPRNESNDRHIAIYHTKTREIHRIHKFTYISIVGERREERSRRRETQRDLYRCARRSDGKRHYTIESFKIFI